MENIPTVILNVLFQFVFLLSFIPCIIREEPLNNNAIPSKDITIIESINGNIIDIKDKISIAIANSIPANRDLWGVTKWLTIISIPITNKSIPSIYIMDIKPTTGFNITNTDKITIMIPNPILIILSQFGDFKKDIFH